MRCEYAVVIDMNILKTLMHILIGLCIMTLQIWCTMYVVFAMFTVATQMYRNLPKLSRLFKDGLVNWLLQMGQPGKGEAFLSYPSDTVSTQTWVL